MSLSKIAVVTLSCLCLCLSMALPAAADAGTGEAAPAESLCSQLAATGTGGTEGAELTLLAAAADCTATANCWDGSTVTCTASGPSAECSATDSDCDNDVRGSCSSSEELKSCPACPCLAPPCSKYEGRSCKPGTRSPECDAGGGTCATCFCFTGGFFVCP